MLSWWGVSGSWGAFSSHVQWLPYNITLANNRWDGDGSGGDDDDDEEEDDEDDEDPPGRGYLLVAGIDPIQISPDGINPECHRLFLRILGRRLLMRASAHSTAWVSTMVLVVRTSAFCDTRFGWCSHTLALWRSAEAYESSSSPFGSFWSAFMFWRSAMTSCSQYPLFWDGISQAPSVPEVRVRPGATIPTQLTSVQLLMWRKRSTFLFASVSSEMPGLPLTSMHFSLMMMRDFWSFKWQVLVFIDLLFFGWCLHSYPV